MHENFLATVHWVFRILSSRSRTDCHGQSVTRQTRQLTGAECICPVECVSRWTWIIIIVSFFVMPTARGSGHSNFWHRQHLHRPTMSLVHCHFIQQSYSLSEAQSSQISRHKWYYCVVVTPSILSIRFVTFQMPQTHNTNEWNFIEVFLCIHSVDVITKYIVAADENGRNGSYEWQISAILILCRQ